MVPRCWNLRLSTDQRQLGPGSQNGTPAKRSGLLTPLTSLASQRAHLSCTSLTGGTVSVWERSRFPLEDRKQKDGDGARVRPRERKEGGNQVGKELHSRSSTLTLEMSQRSSAVSRENAKYRSSPRRTLTRRKSKNLSEWVRAMAL